jgi:hypothetical protein
MAGRKVSFDTDKAIELLKKGMKQALLELSI